MKLKKIVRTLKIYAAITAGVLIASLGINLFLAPHAIVSGGASGVAILVNHLTGFPMGILMLLINIPLFLLGTFILGHGFGIRYEIRDHGELVGGGERGFAKRRRFPAYGVDCIPRRVVHGELRLQNLVHRDAL